MRGYTQTLENGGTKAEGEVQLPRGALGEVVLDDKVDFRSKGLSLCWVMLA